ncbi:MAG: recombinase family protein [Magnetospiraceae bacterium]
MPRNSEKQKNIPSRSKRCAIYTRKSSEEGLEQDFNSLDAQREACEAYITSQKQEGWEVIPTFYDDGGISGGTLERPALKRLLADIQEGLVDTIVIYKIDRLTRSLADFAKLVDIFDAHGVSFVSVTQLFNTSTSMGRLTLSMLLSFAQFEREVTGERIRDKIAASKKKGRWMGGQPPLGCDVQDKKLIIDDAEADTVRHIYQRYADLKSVRALQEDLNQDGVVSKIRVDKHGNKKGGKHLARGALYLMLQNRLYLGEIVHKDTSYPGQHDAIIDEDLWDTVQKLLEQNRVDRDTGVQCKSPSLLAGLIYDDAGNKMVPTHANKKGRRYRYYISKPLLTGSRAATPHGRRVPAGDLEQIVDERIFEFLCDPAQIHDAITPWIQDVAERHALMRRSHDLSQQWNASAPPEKRSILQRLVHRIELGRETLEIHIRSKDLISIPGSKSHWRSDNSPPITQDRPIVLNVPARLKRVGMETRLLIEGAGSGPRGTPDRSLLRLIGQAHLYHAMVMNNQGASISDLAKDVGVGSSYFTRVWRLRFLDPAIVKTILRGQQPIELNAKHMASDSRLPIDWADQRTKFKIAT